MFHQGQARSVVHESQQEKTRILIAEDEGDLRALTADHLRMCGYEVIEFQDGEALLDYVGAQMKHGPEYMKHTDVVLLDIKLPGFSGLQILTSLRHAHLGSPIIMMTALRSDVEREAHRLGATALIRKPFDMEQVVKMLERVEDHSMQVVTNSHTGPAYQLRPFSM